jgi:predicted HTH transcriptional regulator
LTVDKVLACIRNTQYRYMVDDTTLFPKEAPHYNEWVMREMLHNAVLCKPLHNTHYVNLFIMQSSLAS